jgi:hypothetical protein
MSRRWRFTLAATAIAVLGAGPILSSTTASAAPVTSKAPAAEPADPGTALAGLWSADGKTTHLFYVGSDHQLSNWYGDGTAWDNAALGVGEQAAVGTGLTAIYSPDGKESYVFYVGANGHLYDWSYDGKWDNKELGTGEPAALGTGLAAYWSPDGKQINVFYVGANNQVYNWYGDGKTWGNAALGDGHGEAAALGTGLAAYWSPNGKQAHLFYVGANRKVYNWYGDGAGWSNAALGNGDGEPGALGRGLAAFWDPDGTQANLFYIGTDDEVHTWADSDTGWTNSALGDDGEPAGLGRGLAAIWNPDKTQARVFYMGEDSQIYNWVWTGTTWTNSALGSGEAATEGTGLAALWNPDGKRANVYYMADKGAPYSAPIYNWVFNGSSWANGQL